MTLRICHTGDWHLSTKHQRYRTLRRSLSTICDQAREAEVDLVVVAGDIMELHPGPDDVEAVQEMLDSFSIVAPVVVVRGNHDPESWWPVLGRTATRGPVHLSRVPETLALLEAGDLCRLNAVAEPDRLRIRAVVHTLPWPAKGHLLSLLPALPSPEESDQVVRELLSNIIRGFRTDRESTGYTGPSILLGHVEVHGSVMDSGQPNAAPGLTVSVHDIEESGCPVIALGHIHARQGMGDSTYYCGSPCRLTWGEAGAASKGWNLIEFEDDGSDWRVEQHDVPSPRLWTVGATYGHRDGVTGQHFYTDPDDSWADLLQRRELGLVGEQDELRFRYYVAEDMREIAKANLHEVMDVAEDCGIARERVTVEAVTVPAMNARAPEIATEQDLVARFDRWIATEGMTIPEDRLTGLHASIRELEQEVIR